MFDRIRRFFSRSSSRQEQPGTNQGEVDLNKLWEDLQDLIVQNEAKLFFNEKHIKKLEYALHWEKGIVASTSNDSFKRFALRRVRSLQERLNRLSRCSSIYHDNINFNSSLAEKIEEMSAAGMKMVSSEELEEIVLTHEEKFQAHRELMDSVRSIGE